MYVCVTQGLINQLIITTFRINQVFLCEKAKKSAYHLKESWRKINHSVLS